MCIILDKKFFARPAPEVAPDLLGKFLVRRIDGEEVASMITEVEAYEGPRDRASHASRGKTERTKVMFEHPGKWYVYFIYGMYWMLNVVTGARGHPSAVLVRSTEAASGPGRLTKHFQINKSFNEKSAVKRTGLWIEDRGVVIQPRKIQKTARIGVQYAGQYWAKRKHRFVLEE